MLERGKYAILKNSGISTLTTVMALLPVNSTVIVQDDFYSGTRHLIGKIFTDRFKSISFKPTNQVD
jgi:cystathionine beta-lyase/cystathionine gamma-synthase